ncbi:MAG: hypothetical protein JWN04_531, partial [Myxococcaceae bacterium]|nr:hypothetical protein [Myxococcaceae bacterium]
MSIRVLFCLCFVAVVAGCDASGRREDKASAARAVDAPPPAHQTQVVAPTASNPLIEQQKIATGDKDVRSVEPPDFGVSGPVSRARSWVDALRKKDVVALRAISQLPFRFRDSGAEGDCRSRVAEDAKSFVEMIDCLLEDELLAMDLSE